MSRLRNYNKNSKKMRRKTHKSFKKKNKTKLINKIFPIKKK